MPLAKYENALLGTWYLCTVASLSLPFYFVLLWFCLYVCLIICLFVIVPCSCFVFHSFKGNWEPRMQRFLSDILSVTFHFSTEKHTNKFKDSNYSLPFKCHFYFIYSTILKWRPKILVNIRSIFFPLLKKTMVISTKHNPYVDLQLNLNNQAIERGNDMTFLVFISLTSFPGTSEHPHWRYLQKKKKKMIIGLIHRKIFI